MVKLENVVKEAMTTVSKVNEAKSNKRLTVPMASNALGYRGVLILHSVKGAAVLGYERGHGFAVKILGWNDDGTPQLSAPVVVELSKVAVGLSVGYNEVYSVVLFESSTQMEALITDEQVVLGKEFDLSGYTKHPDDSNINVHKSTMAAFKDETKVKPVTLSVGDSLMICDLSLYGGAMNVERTLMKEVYGASASAHSCLQGKTETPEGLRTAMAHITKTLGQLLGQEGHTGKPATAAPAAAEPAAEPAAVAAAEPAAAPAAAEPAAAPAAAAEPAAAPAAAAEPAVAAAPAAAVEATPMEQ
ncbi:hypothetical protein CHLRE_12g541550v5 [Chlamydomonas reinhardtii]|uniref:Ysc84 actin-binding domain-containing protein n=1 Tax=Chlamydomonas reinhardtii TaxID=3055 RepID=A0A2K3D6V3_CHLRE|nr:uncharacterized protein CHLRE_12g541550v5 [Chlamydomonas reinhardtii]PNW76263.1 hypothetical protein CHLRE_12g541550v5 [Chlamydomonas reinhardtii]